MILSVKQMQELDNAQLSSFVGRAMSHVQEFFPEVAARAGSANLRKIIDATIQRAHDYGIKSEQDIATFLDLTIAFGWNFDRDRAWARRCLTEPGYGEPATRVNLLFAAALAQAEMAPSPQEHHGSAPTT